MVLESRITLYFTLLYFTLLWLRGLRKFNYLNRTESSIRQRATNRREPGGNMAPSMHYSMTETAFATAQPPAAAKEARAYTQTRSSHACTSILHFAWH